MSGHTKGPWYFHEMPDGWCISTAKTKRAAGSHNAICGSEADYDPLWNEAPSEADARLIASAPDLLEALEQISAEYENANLSHHDFRVGARLVADAAIAKAKGHKAFEQSEGWTR